MEVRLPPLRRRSPNGWVNRLLLGVVVVMLGTVGMHQLLVGHHVGNGQAGRSEGVLPGWCPR